MSHKIFKLQQTNDIFDDLRNQGKTIVHCHGCFDLIHHGHIKHFEAAKKFGDILVVTLTEDQFVNKGPDRPYFNHDIRAHNLAALEVVDYVAINFAPTAIPAIESIKPNFYVKGQDYKNAADDVTGGIIKEKNAVQKNGGDLVFTEEVQFSSSTLINQFFDDKEERAKQFLSTIKENFSYNHFSSLFNRISKKKVLIIGDVIIDEYQFVKPIGKASKSPTITAIQGQSELYAGGVLAVANHVADFVEEVVLITTIGKNKNKDFTQFINDNLHSKVKLLAIETEDRPTVLKSRIVDQVFRHKLFEVIEIEDTPLSSTSENDLIQLILDEASKSDLSLIADFGHGTLTSRVIDNLIESAKFLAVNAQTNSANLGYNLLTKYKRCDYFSIDKGEAHLAVHDKFGDIAQIQAQLQRMTKAKVSSITLGVEGTSVMDNNNNTKSPIFNSDVVDTIGAGDAYLSITSLLAEEGASLQEIAFVGNAVGSMAVKIIGNKSYITKIDLLKYIKTLLA